jgi:hypothetical protein
MKIQPVIPAAIAFSLCLALLPRGAFAGSQEIIDEMHDAAEKDIQADRLRTDAVAQDVDQETQKVLQVKTDIFKQEQKDESESAEHTELLPAIDLLPKALAQQDTLINDLMITRYRELNRQPIPTDSSSASTTYKPEYLVDTSLVTPVDVQAFDIFMRYFCDPNARGGLMKTMQFNLANVLYQQRKTNYTLGCGVVSGASIQTRQSVLGSGDTSDEAKQIIGLPLRPADLYFNPGTFPTTPGTTANGKKTTNTNPLAEVYFAAFAQSLEFLVGEAPAASNDLNTQAAISRQMLASYPFAVLFAERAGSMDDVAPQALAGFMMGKLGKGTEDPAIVARLQNLQGRTNVSLAEYMDLIMYQLPLSPGYHAYIENTRNTKKLIREEVWLTAMQTALNYQRNRWLEILATLEAVK